MKLEREFPVERSREEIVKVLADDAVLERLLPDTRIEPGADGTRQTFTRYSALGQERELHLIFRTEASGDLRFEKVCNGKIWRSLDGRIELESLETSVTNVRLEMVGKTKPLVPEISIRGTMEEQLDQMVDSLQSSLGVS